jgi:hypothetical protein
MMIIVVILTRETEAGSTEIGVLKRVGYVLTFVVRLLLVTESASYLIKRCMILLSFRYESDVVIALHDPAYRRVKAMAQTARIPLCAAPLGNNLWMLQDATVVWNGVGAISYLRLGAPNEQHPSSDKSVLISLPANEVDPIRVTPALARKCFPAEIG